MKLEYRKPSMEVVKFQVNEAIASCGALLFNHTVESCADNPSEDSANWTDLAKSFYNKGIAFVEDMSSCASAPLGGYCYFTSASADDNQLLMNS